LTATSLCFVLAADNKMNHAAQQEDAVDNALTQQHVSEPLRDTVEALVNCDNGWEQNADELVSWTDALEL